MVSPHVERINDSMKWTAVAVFLTVFPAGAITLQEAVGIALDNRGDVQAAIMSYQSADWDSHSC